MKNLLLSITISGDGLSDYMILILGAFYLVLFISFIICFFSSLAIDKNKKDSTNRTFRILKRCFSWVLAVLSLGFIATCLFSNFYMIMIILSYLFLIIAIILLFLNIKNKGNDAE